MAWKRNLLVSTTEERVAHEALGRWILRLFGKVWQRTILETVWYTRTGDNLLTYTSHHLSDVDLTTFEPQTAMTKGALCRLSSVMQISPTSLRTPESTPEIIVLERLLLVTTREVLELAMLGLFDQVKTLCISSFDLGVLVLAQLGPG